MKIMIRADGGPSIGMGHIMRTLVLAGHLSQGAEVAYICRKGSKYDAGAQMVRDQGFPVFQLQEDRIREAMKEIPADCLITDSYEVDESYFSQMREIYKVTGVVDDLNQFAMDVDFVINQNIDAESLKYQVPKDTKLFLGSGYVLLRDEFVGLPAKFIAGEIRQVLVTMGGADPENMTTGVVQHIHQAYPDIKLYVAIGPSFGNASEIKALEDHRTIVYFMPKLAQLMLTCDAAVSACGSTLYELAACGTPTIGMVTAQNQQRMAGEMERRGALMIAEDLQDLPLCLGRMTQDKRWEMSDTMKSLVDGNGGCRLAAEILPLIKDKINCK